MSVWASINPKKLLKKLILIFSFFIIIFALLVTAARMFLPLVEKHPRDLEKVVSNALHQPVSIGHVETAWHFFQPMFRLDNVKLFSKDTHQPAITIEHLYVGINIFKSLFYRQFEPGLLIISGATLSIQQDKEGHFMILGVTQKKEEPFDLMAFKKWLSTQQTFELQGITLFIEKASGEKIKADLNLLFRYSIERAKMKGTVSLKEKGWASKLNFVMNVGGDFGSTNGYHAKLYLSGTHVNLKKWLEGKIYHQLQLLHGSGDFQWWGTIKEGKLKSFLLDVNLNHVEVQDQVTRKAVSLKRVNGEFAWRLKRNQQWRFMARRLKITKETPWPNVDMSLEGKGKEILKFYLNNLSLKNFFDIANLQSNSFKEFQEGISHLQPQGNIEGMELSFDPEKNTKMPTQYSLYLTNLSWQAWDHIPKVGGLQLRVSGDPEQIELQGVGAPTSLWFEKTYEKPITLSSVSLRGLWQKKEDKKVLLVPEATFTTPHESLTTRGKIIFFDKASPEVHLVGNLNSDYVDPQLIESMLPTKILSPDFVTWMKQAFKPGGTFQSQFIWRGSLKDFPYEDGSGIFRIRSEFSGIHFQFDPLWPALDDLNATLDFSQNELHIHGSSATTLGISVGSIDATLPFVVGSQPSILSVEENVHTRLEDALSYLMQTPVKKVLGDDFNSLQWKGPADLNLQMKIPISNVPKDAPVTFLAKGTILNGEVILPFKSLSLNHIQGILNITEKGVSSDNMKGMFLKNPATLELSTKTKGNVSELNADLKGSTNTSEMSQLLNISLAPYAAGNFDFSAHLGYEDSGKISLSVMSDLKGVNVMLPAPFNKPKEIGLPAEVSFEPSKNQYITHFHYGEVVAGAMAFEKSTKAPQDLSISKGHLHFGEKSTSLPVSQKLIVDGSIPQFSFSDWKAFFEKNKGKGKSSFSWKDISKLVQNIQLTVGHLFLLDQDFKQILLNIQLEADQVIVAASGDTVDGTFYIPWNLDELFQLQLTKLYLTPFSKSTLPGDSQPFSPQSLPPFIVSCADFRYGQKVFGQVGFKTSKIQDGLRIDKFVAFNPYYAFNGKGTWTLSKQKQKTEISGAFTSQDLHAALKQWELPANLHGKHAEINFNMNWPGSLLHFTRQGLEGVVNFRMGEGSITGLNTKTDTLIGFGRLISLLSLQSLPRRLTLNFGDLLHKGFYFEKIQGDWTLKDGNATTRNTYLDGSVAYVAINGAVDLLNEQYHLRLLVAPHLTSSIPIVATIAGGPVVGGVAWAINQLITPEVQRIAHYTYSVEGPWRQPEVKPVHPLKSVRPSS